MSAVSVSCALFLHDIVFLLRVEIDVPASDSSTARPSVAVVTIVQDTVGMTVPVIREAQLHITILNILYISDRGVCKAAEKMSSDLTHCICLGFSDQISNTKRFTAT